MSSRWGLPPTAGGHGIPSIPPPRSSEPTPSDTVDNLWCGRRCPHDSVLDHAMAPLLRRASRTLCYPHHLLAVEDGWKTVCVGGAASHVKVTGGHQTAKHRAHQQIVQTRPQRNSANSNPASRLCGLLRNSIPLWQTDRKAAAPNVHKYLFSVASMTTPPLSYHPAFPPPLIEQVARGGGGAVANAPATDTYPAQPRPSDRSWELCLPGKVI